MVLLVVGVEPCFDIYLRFVSTRALQAGQNVLPLPYLPRGVSFQDSVLGLSTRHPICLVLVLCRLHKFGFHGLTMADLTWPRLSTPKMDVAIAMLAYYFLKIPQSDACFRIYGLQKLTACIRVNLCYYPRSS